VSDLSALLQETHSGFGLPRTFYTDAEIFAAEREHIWHREWVLAGVAASLTQVGQYEQVRIGAYELLLVHGDDGKIRALHNVCRHRGFVLCESEGQTTEGIVTGQIKGRRIVCPYHQWAYSLDGSLVKARSMPDDFDESNVRLGEAHCEVIGGLIFVCVAEIPPPFEPFRTMVEPYLAPFDLATAVVAHRTVTIEQGNWKLVMENNRECFHCSGSHHELMRSFPSEPFHAGNARPEDTKEMEELVNRCESLGLPSRFVASKDMQYRVMRMPFNPGVESMTMFGTPAVNKRFPKLPNESIGDALLYHYPSSWNHFQADHCVIFRLVPVSPSETQLVTTWLVPQGSREGEHYDLAALTEVWEATNAQDALLVERNQRGVSSPGYRPGRYSPAEEVGVIQFVDWYVGRLSAGIARDTSS
jgi:phenylpropionate dioxygenase-like ring-hydroxylating dioxygenase large terminal subunit